MNNGIIVVFNYFADFRVGVSKGVHSRRLLGKWLFSTKVPADNFAHFQMKVGIGPVVSMVIVEMNDYYKCCFLIFCSVSKKIKQFVHDWR